MAQHNFTGYQHHLQIQHITSFPTLSDGLVIIEIWCCFLVVELFVAGNLMSGDSFTSGGEKVEWSKYAEATSICIELANVGSVPQ